MKYNVIAELLNADAQKLIRHDAGSKSDEWTGYQSETVEISQDLANLLGPVFDIPAGFSPMDGLPDQFQDSVFIAKRFDGQLFLVNTEGFDYSRYIAFVKIKTEKTMDDFEKHLNSEGTCIVNKWYGSGTILRATDPARFVELFDSWAGRS